MTSQDKLARVTGLLYLVMIVSSGLALVSSQNLMADTAAVAIANIEARQTFIRLGIVSGAVASIFSLILALAIYKLFAPTSKMAASIFVVLMVAAQPLGLVGLSYGLDILSLLDGASGDVLLMLRSWENLTTVSTIFWGVWLIPLAWMVFYSGFLPRLLGILLVLGFVTYVLNFIGGVFDASYSDSRFARVVFILTGIPSGIGEIGTALWLLIMGMGKRNRSSHEPARTAHSA